MAGTQEPVYGPSALHSVAKQAEETPYTELTRNDLKWHTMDSTCVETQVFYSFTETGTVILTQLIYNNVA